MGKRQQLRALILIADVLWATCSLIAALFFRYHSPAAVMAQWAHWWSVLSTILLLWVLLFPVLELDGFHGGWRGTAIMSKCLIGVTALMAMILVGGYIGRYLRSRLVLGYFALLYLCGLMLIRFLVDQAFRYSKRSGQLVRTLIVGNGHLAHETARRIQRHPELFWEIVGFVGPTQPMEKGSGGPQKMRTLQLLDFVRTMDINQVVIAFDQPLVSEIRKLIDQLRLDGVTIIQVPTQLDIYSRRPHLIDLDGIPLISFEEVRLSAFDLACKQLLDRVVAFLLLVASAPVLLGLGLIATIRFGSPFVYLRRTGLHGREFNMYRLNWGRFGPGDLMRRTGISELPQLVNVLKGDMSLVGPRPESPEVTQRYSDWQRKRLEVLPGITGMAQVHGLREFHRHHNRYSYDLEYILHRSLWRDITIIIQTIFILGGGRRNMRLAADESSPLTGVTQAKGECQQC